MIEINKKIIIYSPIDIYNDFMTLIFRLSLLVLLIEKNLKKIVAPTRNWKLLFLQTKNLVIWC